MGKTQFTDPYRAVSGFCITCWTYGVTNGCRIDCKAVNCPFFPLTLETSRKEYNTAILKMCEDCGEWEDPKDSTCGICELAAARRKALKWV